MSFVGWPISVCSGIGSGHSREPCVGASVTRTLAKKGLRDDCTGSFDGGYVGAVDKGAGAPVARTLGKLVLWDGCEVPFAVVIGVGA